MKCIHVSAGEERFCVSSTAIPCGNDWVVTVCGGEQAHVGAVSVGQYEPLRDSATVSTITLYTHRDDRIAARFAKAIATAEKCNVTVTAGIHVDDAGAEEIAELTENCENCLQKLLMCLEEKKCD